MSFPLSRSIIPLFFASVSPIVMAPDAAAARSWDEQSQSIVRQFPSLLPATPSARGYHDARCARSEIPDTALHALGCRDRDDVLFQVIQFPSSPAVDRFLDTHQLGPPSRTTIEDGTQAEVSAGKCRDASCFVVTFEAEDRANYVILVAHNSATLEDLVEYWWPNADFTNGRTA